MVWWLTYLAATLEEPGSNPHLDLSVHLLFFLFLPVYRFSSIVGRRRLHFHIPKIPWSIATNIHKQYDVNDITMCHHASPRKTFLWTGTWTTDTQDFFVHSLLWHLRPHSYSIQLISMLKVLKDEKFAGY